VEDGSSGKVEERAVNFREEDEGGGGAVKGEAEARHGVVVHEWVGFGTSVDCR